jgi:hypothetical protein
MNNEFSCRFTMLLLFLLSFYLIIAGAYGLRWTQENSLYTMILSFGLSVLIIALLLILAYWIGYYLQNQTSPELVQLGLDASP